MRKAALVGSSLWLTPVLGVGLTGFGIPASGAILLGVCLAAALAWPASRVLADTLRPAAGSRVVLTAALVFSAAAVVEIGRIAPFMADVTRTEWAFASSDAWRSRHCCLTAYSEASRFVAEPGRNIYEPTQYEPSATAPRILHGLKVDPYHYPPPFLLLPRALHVIGGDFLRVRALWFAFQALILGATVLFLPRWVGGRAGGVALVGALLFLALPQVAFSLQQGNFQNTAIPLAVAAFVLFWYGRYAIAAPMLAYAALSKIFPGVLVLYLLAARRWRALLWTAAAGAVLVMLSAAVFGTQPFLDFLGYEIPRISSGEGFPQSERPRVAPHNMSVYGLTVRLRLLGAEWLPQTTGLTIASWFGFFVLALTALTGYRHRVDLSTIDGRMQLLQIGVALITLGSFRSPFVGGYGVVSTLWLMTLIGAGCRDMRTVFLWFAGTAALSAAQWAIPSAGYAVTRWGLALSAAVMATAIAFCLFVAVRAVLRPREVEAQTSGAPRYHFQGQ